MMRSVLLTLLVTSACRTETLVAPIPDVPDEFDVSFVLDADSTAAGQAVGYTVTVTNRGEPVDASWSLASDVEDSVLFSLEDVTPIVAGEHELTVDVDAGEGSTSVSALLTVAADRVYDLDLKLADAGALAGDSVTYEVTAIDRYGNDVAVDDVSVAADSADLVVDAGTLTSTVPGSYLVTAELDGVEDVEPFWVDPGTPDSVDLTLSTLALRRGGTANATIDIRDAFGNETWAEWTLTTDRPSDTVVSGQNVTFNEDGWHTVTVTLDVSGLSDSEGPLLIDDTGPVISGVWPERAEWTTAISETVRGVVEDAWSNVSLSINDQDVTVETDGAYALGVSLPWGVSPWDIVATDEAGNITSQTSAVLSGEYLPYGSPAANAVTARLAEGPGGTDALEDLGRGLIDAQDFASLIPNPVFSDRSESCIDPCGGWFGGCRFCFTWYSVVLRTNNPTFGASDLRIDPRAGGALDLTLSIASPRIPWNASGVVAEIGYSGSGTIEADRIDVDLRVRPRVVNGELRLDLESVNTRAVNFDLRFANWLQTALGFFGFDADAYLGGLLEDAVDDAVRDTLPDVLEDALNSFELDFAIPVGSNELDVVAQFSSVLVDEQSLRLGLGTTVTPDSWTRPSQGLGSLAGNFAPPSTGAAGTQFGLSVDLLNQVAYAAWGAGLLDIQESASELGLPEDELQLFLPGVTAISAVVDPLLPPAVVPGTGGDDFDLQIGDLELTLYDGAPSAGDVIIRVYITAIAGLSMGAVGDDRLVADVGNADLWFDVTVPDSNTQAAADTEALVEAIVPLLLPRITDVFSEIELPSFAGFRVSGVQVGTAGESDATLVIGGDLVPE